MKSKQEIKSRVYKFYENNKDKGKKYVAAHFMAEGVPKATIYRHIESAATGKPLARKKGSGRKPKINTPKNRAKLTKMFNHRKGMSLRKAAKVFNCHHKTIWEILKTLKRPVLCYKRTKRPGRTPLQRLLARPKCRDLYRNYRNSDFIIDDESYFTLSNSSFTGNDSYYSNDRTQTPDTVKYIDVVKFEEKVLVWMAISPKGPSGLAVNQEVYLNECIVKRLMPFIEKHYQKDKYVFWPDLASSHYANSVTNWLDDHKVPFVPKTLNPANVPEARAIEDWWAILKREVYKNGWAAKNVDQLRNRIMYCVKNIDVKVVQDLAASTHKRLDQIRRYGVK